MKNIIVKIISAIFHPLLMPSYAIIFFFLQDTWLATYHFELKKSITIIIFLTTSIAPLIFLLILLNINKISDLNLEKRRERTLPFATITLCYAGTYIILTRFSIKLPLLLVNFMLVSTISVFVTMIINFITKISVHAVAISCFFSCGIIFFWATKLEIIWFIVYTIILIGLISTARLKLNAHKPFQIYIGLIIGFLIGLSVVFI